MVITTLLLDFFFPKRCVGCKKFGDFLCPACFSTISLSPISLCAVCNKHSVDGLTHPLCCGKYTIDGVFSAVEYRGIVKKMIYKFKYPPYLSALHTDMAALLYESVIQNEVAYKKIESSTLFVPIPLHAKRYRKRGYNHAELLAREFGRRTGKPVVTMLARIKETKPQFSLSREERYKNLKDAFVLKNQYKPKVMGEHIVLIDDLATSGATLNACANILKRAGVKNVWGVTFARE